jgi:caspase-like apoptosis-related cysteine protease
VASSDETIKSLLWLTAVCMSLFDIIYNGMNSKNIASFLFSGFYSWRNNTDGSWFVQSLCSELQDKGTSVDILTLLTFVIQRVALNFESNTPDNHKRHQKKQIPCVTTKLRRLLQFARK